VGWVNHNLDTSRRFHLEKSVERENKAMWWVLRSKIHQALVTEANVDYIGSITIDEALIEKVGLWPGEKVPVVSNTSGARLETYIIAGERHSGVMCINGAAAHLIKAGEEIIVMGFELTDTPLSPTVILVDRTNTFMRYL
jgi:aspartate 1-decarboxylase